MGEYAKFGKERIKIGTCESMYYLRYEDRNKVEQLPGNVNPAKDTDLFWRLPFPDEDQLEPGSYTEYNRGIRLYKTNGEGRTVDFTLDNAEDYPGNIQLVHQPSGLLVNIKCFHGMKLPKGNTDFKPFWNGKGHSFELCSIKNTDDEIKPVVRCRHCGHQWSFSADEWAEISEFIPDPVLRERLSIYIK